MPRLRGVSQPLQVGRVVVCTGVRSGTEHAESSQRTRVSSIEAGGRRRGYRTLIERHVGQRVHDGDGITKVKVAIGIGREGIVQPLGWLSIVDVSVGQRFCQTESDTIIDVPSSHVFRRIGGYHNRNAAQCVAEYIVRSTVRIGHEWRRCRQAGRPLS